jgi:hypothetical protein
MEVIHMTEVLIFATILMPIITGLVQLAKKTVNIKNNFLSLIALAVGLFVGFAASPFTDLDLVLRLWAGGLAGLSATGLYELMDNQSGKSKEE